MNTFAERLAILRKRAGIKQEDLAAEVDVSIDSIRRWEGGKQEPRLSELKRLANVLGVHINELVGEDTETTTEITQERVMKPRQSKPQKKGMIVIQQGNTNIEFPATPQGYAILKEKLKEVSINQFAPFSAEEV